MRKLLFLTLMLFVASSIYAQDAIVREADSISVSLRMKKEWGSYTPWEAVDPPVKFILQSGAFNTITIYPSTPQQYRLLRLKDRRVDSDGEYFVWTALNSEDKTCQVELLFFNDGRMQFGVTMEEFRFMCNLK